MSGSSKRYMSLTSLTQTKEIIAANLVDDTPHRQQGDRRLMLTQPRPRDGPKYPPPKLTTYSKARYTTSQDLTTRQDSPCVHVLQSAVKFET